MTLSLEFFNYAQDNDNNQLSAKSLKLFIKITNRV